MNKHLILIYNEQEMFFTYGEDEIKTLDRLTPGYVYSRAFSNINLKFLESKVLIDEEEFEYGASIQINNATIIVHKHAQFVPYKIEKFCVINNELESSDVCLDVKVPVIIEKHHSHFELTTSDNLFVNGAVKTGTIKLTVGDYILIDNELIFVTANGLKMRSEVSVTLPPDYSFTSKVNPKSYHRSPRLFHVIDEEPITIESPPQKPSKQEKTLVKIIVPPLVMMSITVAISILMGRGLFIVISIMATLMALVNSIQTYIDGRKKFKKDTKDRELKYQDYLTDKSIEINLRIQEEIKNSNYHMLPPNDIIDIVAGESRRIFERSSKDSDFLNVRIGSQSRPAKFDIKLQSRKIGDKYDELYEDAHVLKSSFKDIDNVGLSIDLKEANVGIVGTRELSILLVKQMLLELMTFHSYHDVQLLTIFDQDQLEELSWLAYAPHSTIESISVRGLIYNEVLRDQILGSFVQILKSRENKYKEDNKTVFAPHYVVSILASDLIREHIICEYVDQDISHLGVSIVVVESEHENLKENIGTVIEIYSKLRSKLLIDQGEYVKSDFTVDELPSNQKLLDHARMLQGFNHVLKSEDGLPQTITFMEMYEADTIDELQIARRWDQNDSTKTLAVRLGVNGDDYVDLNLHEKAHGPHGLVAGTTGSGKSEIVQSYILSLAVNFSPHEVSFLLIDYKGGGMANLFKDMPHLIGTITNLDGDGSMRALVSIKSELLRRQAIFSEHNVNHINQYINLFKSGKASEPMPHLFLISDEFAELKSEQPEFMAELVSTARIGRSLGVHLILATQKPSGVVDSQIWSNSKFKLCLKVQDEADSKEMLKTTDAAHIVEPGRAYLQVGNNEVYELFQSAWSGADYHGIKQAKQIDNRIYQINKLGQYKLLTNDLSGNIEGQTPAKRPTELEAVVKAVADVFVAKDLVSVAPIWLEDLSDRYYLDDYVEIDFDLGIEKMMFGLADLPSKQKQVIYEYSLQELGNLSIIGSSGYGKSFTLMSGLLSIFARNKPTDVYSYILDFGNNSLINMRELPHVAEYISIDDIDKVGKLIKIISEEIVDRKRKFSQAGANHISVYNELNDDKISKIIIALDNFDVVRDELPEFDEFIQKITRDCTSLGIYFMSTASRANAYRMVMANNIKTRIALFNTDKHEYSSMIGKSDFMPKDQPGSALVKCDELAAVMQVFMPARAETDAMMVKALTEKVESIKNMYNGPVPKGIAVVSDELTATEFLQSVTRNEDEIILGVDYETVEPVIIKTTDLNQVAVISSDGHGKTNFIKFLAQQNIPNAMVVAKNDSPLKEVVENAQFIDLDQKRIFETAVRNNVLDGKILLIENAEDITAHFSLMFVDLFAQGLKDGRFKAISCANTSSLKESRDDYTMLLRNTKPTILQVNLDQQVYVNYDRAENKEFALKIGDGIYCNGSKKSKIRIPLA